jgi:hypothetical protein
MNVRHYAPSVWLQLSQLHTLRGVDLSVVSIAAIAVALPRLHTLVAFAFTVVPDAAVAGFAENLLPRLHVFQYVGRWSQNLQLSQYAASPCALPHLRALTVRGFGNHPPSWTWFMGAPPLELCADDVMIERWLPPPAVAECDDFRPLASVRVLQIDVQSSAVFTPTTLRAWTLTRLGWRRQQCILLALVSWSTSSCDAFTFSGRVLRLYHSTPSCTCGSVTSLYMRWRTTSASTSSRRLTEPLSSDEALQRSSHEKKNISVERSNTETVAVQTFLLLPPVSVHKPRSVNCPAICATNNVHASRPVF